MRYEVGTRLFYIDGILPPVACAVVEKFTGNRDAVRDRVVLLDGASDPVAVNINDLWYGEAIAANIHRCRTMLKKIRDADNQRHRESGGVFGVGEEFWCEKIRFWEDRIPSRVRISSVYSREYDDHERWIHAHSSEYGHPVYLERVRCWFVKIYAIRTSRLRTIENDLRHESDIDYIMQSSKWS